MNSYELKVALPSDVYGMALREHEEDVIGRQRLADTIANSYLAQTFWRDNVIHGICGFCQLWSGVAEVYIIPTVHIPKYPFRFQSNVRKTLNEWSEKYALHRMQSHSWDEFTTNRWMEMLGFTCEGVLQKYTWDGLNYRLWARTR